MVNRFLKFVNTAIIKKPVEHIKSTAVSGLEYTKLMSGIMAPQIFDELKKSMRIVKKTAITGLAISSILGGILSPQLVAEYKESQAGENNKIDFRLGDANIILKNEEDRTYDDLFEDVENAILNMEGLGESLKKESMTLKEKEEFVNNIIKIMSKTANIDINGFKTTSIFGEKSKGFVLSYVGKNITISSNVVYINKDVYENGNPQELFELSVHETLHLIDAQNVARSGKISEAELSMRGKEFLSDYLFSFDETNVYLRTSSIIKTVYSEYDINESRPAYLDSILKEALNLIDGNARSEIGAYVNNFIELEDSSKGYEELSKKYGNLTIREVFYKALQIKFKGEFSETEFENTEFAKDFEEFVKEDKWNHLDVKLRDMETFTEEHVDLEYYSQRIDEGLARDFDESYYAWAVGNVSYNLRYNSDDYSLGEVDEMYQFLFKYVNELSEERIDDYGLHDVLEAKAQNDVSLIEIVNPINYDRSVNNEIDNEINYDMEQ